MAAGKAITLTPMAPGRDEQFAAMLEEFRAAGEMDVYGGHQAVAWRGYCAYYDLLSRMKRGGYPTPEIVPMDSYFIEEDGQILGELFVRHRLSDQLEKIGGHIGYRVRPSQRNRGVATAALKLGLQKLNELGVSRALVTCNDRNVASAKVIEKCEGSRIEDAVMEQRIERRYLVPTARHENARVT
jgi:predicted acetyltransferase